MRSLRGYTVLFALWFVLLQLHSDAPLVGAVVRFTNVQCIAYDKSANDFRYCGLKVMKRGVVVLNMYLELHNKPINNITMQAELFRKTNGPYSPYLYKINVDFCEFMRKPSRQPVLDIFIQMLTKASNLNHTCPYNHDIIIDSLIVDDNVLRLLPFPKGDYMVSIKSSIAKHLANEVKTYVSVGNE